MRLPASESLHRASESDHGVLATLHPDRGVDAVPVCFAIESDVVAIPIDRVKPKDAATLQRVRNLAANPRASLLCEQWDRHDWSRLWWVRLALVRSDEPAERVADLERALRQRYPQYATAPFASIVTLRIVQVAGWSAT